MYKVSNGLSPEIMNEIFQIREESRYNLRYTSHFTIPPIHSVYNCRESVSYMGHKIWELIPPAFKQINSLSGFKKAIKEWKPSKCPCRLCKTYISSWFPIEKFLKRISLFKLLKIGWYAGFLWFAFFRERRESRLSFFFTEKFK